MREETSRQREGSTYKKMQRHEGIWNMRRTAILSQGIYEDLIRMSQEMQ